MVIEVQDERGVELCAIARTLPDGALARTFLAYVYAEVRGHGGARARVRLGRYNIRIEVDGASVRLEDQRPPAGG